MPLQQGDVQGYDFNRSVVEFTMLNQGKVILCAISTAAMDHLEGRRGVKPDRWPAPGSEDTELGVLMEPEVRHGAAEVYAGVQA